MARASENALNELHYLVAEVLANRLRSDECTSADIANAIKFLKENSITCDPDNAPHMDQLVDNIPDFEGVSYAN